jgi:nitrogen fixation/metabolism regulation signal transduction histidine kinase
MASRKLKRLAYTVSMTLGVALASGALLLLARYATVLGDFGQRQVQVLALNALAAAVLLVLICVQAALLVRDFRRHRAGARLRTRLVTTFVGLTVLPLAAVFFFAFQFLNNGIDSWFDRGLEDELSSAMRLSRESLDVQSRSRLLQVTGLATAIGRLEGDTLARALGVLRADAGAEELAVFDGERRALATSSTAERMAPQLPAEALEDLATRGRFVSLEPEGPTRYQVRAIVSIAPSPEDGATRYLQAVFAVSDRQGRLVDSVQETYTRYAELRFIREPLKYSLTLTLALVLLLSLLAAVAAAMLVSRRLVEPIESLMAGTEAVARGNLDTPLAAGGRDEVGSLIESFNMMMARLKQAREDTRDSQQLLERERANLAAILGRLTTGVIALNADGTIRIANDAAGTILDVEPAMLSSGRTLQGVGESSPLVEQLLAVWRENSAESSPDWRGQVELRGDGARRILNCALSTLPGEGGAPGGTILVFDDVTELLLAQREAAWGEVARRLAHEIKNPLTPIRLAAERIRRRYLPAMSVDEGQVLERSTHTIVQQVEAMRDMVNAFGEYARAPEMQLSRVELNQLVREVAWLYRAQDGQPGVTLALDEAVGHIEADEVQVRQLLHNLIRNAQEALEGRPGGAIEIRTSRVVTGEREFAELAVSDNGPGIDGEVLQSVFEPYVTTKKKGTGLGLAIVRKLVEEHGGTVAAENLPEGGARLSIRFPARADGADDGRRAVIDSRRQRA